jgi:hypothetical protein
MMMMMILLMIMVMMVMTGCDEENKIMPMVTMHLVIARVDNLTFSEIKRYHINTVKISKRFMKKNKLASFPLKKKIYYCGGP